MYHLFRGCLLQHLHHDGGAEVAEHHRGHEDAEGAAEEDSDQVVLTVMLCI